MRKIWEKHRKWITVAAALMLVALVAAIAQAAAPPAPRIQAEPPAESEVTFDMEKNRAYNAEDGIVVIPASFIPASDLPAAVPTAASVITDTPEDVWKEGEAVTSRGYTLPEQAQMADGSIGVLTVPKLGLTVNVFETDDEMEVMTKGLAHFKTSSAWEGNICLCGHNINFDLTDGYLKNIHTLKEGDTLFYRTALGQRTYSVTAVKEIADDDWSWLGRTEDNRITLVTCVSGKPTARLVVQAVEKG